MSSLNGRVAGWLGAAATTLAFVMPSITLSLIVAHLHSRNPDGPIGVALRRGLTPITIGLIFATGWILLPAVTADWRGYVLSAITIALVLRTDLNPLWLLGAGALAGVSGLV